VHRCHNTLKFLVNLNNILAFDLIVGFTSKEPFQLHYYYLFLMLIFALEEVKEHSQAFNLLEVPHLLYSVKHDILKNGLKLDLLAPLLFVFRLRKEMNYV
jgi:hypothetical protein